MLPIETKIDKGEIMGQTVILHVDDIFRKFAEDGPRNTAGDDAWWNNKAIVVADGHAVIDIHEWEDDDTDYDTETELAGAVYYDIYALNREGTAYEIEDGGIFLYTPDSTMIDFALFIKDQMNEIVFGGEL